jgi:hypothetical protein
MSIDDTNAIRLRVVALIGDLGALISHLDTHDELVRNPNIGKPVEDSFLVKEALTEAHHCANIAVARCYEMAEARSVFAGIPSGSEEEDAP